MFSKSRSLMLFGSFLMAFGLAGLPKATQAATPVVVQIAKIDKSQVGKYVTIKATLLEAGNFSKGFKFVAGDDTGKMGVTYFENTWDTLPKPELLKVGAVVQITGKVSEYQGEFEIVPNRGRETLVLSPTIPISLTARNLGGLNNGDFGAIVFVSGEVYSAEPFDGGSEVIISDKTGAQKVRLWNVVAKRVAKDVLVKGTKVNVIGKVKTSKKTGLRIEVALPSDVTVVKQPSAVSVYP